MWTLILYIFNKKCRVHVKRKLKTNREYGNFRLVYEIFYI